jgi:eukaryotic-like serine/threonine-protein kinase
MIGTKVGHYEIVERLGAGGMGVVYRARDTRLDRPAALKALPAELTSNADSLRRFEREAKALAALNHPNIVTVYSIEESEGAYFLAMELVEGRTLAERIPERGMSVAAIFEVATALADALAAAHEKGIVHRDLKPANVMVTSEGRVKVLDFGLARRLPEALPAPTAPTRSLPLTREGTLLGTAPYMSPEQVRGEEADARSDIFALGTVLHEMATGRRPFTGESSVELFHSILTAHPRPIDEQRPELPHHLARIIGRCLEKEPRRRYQSALDVRNELDGLAREVESATHSPTARAKTPLASRPPWRRWVWIAAGLGLAAATIGAWLVVGRAAERPAGAGADEPAAIRSLAVLPFTNLMNDPEQVYFVDGVQEALITDLSKIASLRVISRTSTMRYRGTEKPLPEIAQELGVDALIEGSVLRAGESVRITAQLIRGDTDEHLWAESYDRDLRDVLSLLSEVAGRIADAIELKLAPEVGARLAPRRAVDPDVLEVYLRGRHELNRLSREGLSRARELGRRTVELDPDWAEGHVLVAASNVLLRALGGLAAEETVPEARAAAQRALELDPGLSEAHNALGWLRLYVDWDWEGAATSFRRALELNPNDAFARHGYGDYLCAMGRAEEGLAQVELGRKADPLNHATVMPALYHHLLARRYEEAIVAAHAAEQLFPDSRAPRNAISLSHWFLGRRQEAMADWIADLRERDEEAANGVERALRASGVEVALGRLAGHYDGLGRAGRQGASNVAGWQALAGDVERAFEWLERAYEQRTSNLFLIRTQPQFDGLRSDSRYRDLMSRLDLEP